MPIPMPIPNLEFRPIPDTDTYAIFSQTPIPILWKSTDTIDTDTDTIGASLIYTEIGEKYKNIITSMSKKAQKKPSLIGENSDGNQ